MTASRGDDTTYDSDSRLELCTKKRSTPSLLNKFLHSSSMSKKSLWVSTSVITQIHEIDNACLALYNILNWVDAHGDRTSSFVHVKSDGNSA